MRRTLSTLSTLTTEPLLRRRAAPAASADDRGDVPGWVLITVMTAALVVGLWAVAAPALNDMFTNALGSVTGP